MTRTSTFINLRRYTAEVYGPSFFIEHQLLFAAQVYQRGPDETSSACLSTGRPQTSVVLLALRYKFRQLLQGRSLSTGIAMKSSGSGRYSPFSQFRKILILLEEDTVPAFPATSNNTMKLCTESQLISSLKPIFAD